MKNIVKVYSIIWILAVALFNIIVFITPNDIANKLNGSFWVGYVFIMLAFIALFMCTAIALKADTLTKVFYRFSIISICYISIGVMLIIGSMSMLIPILQPWLCIILCSLVLGMNIISVLSSVSSATIVENIDKKIAEQTTFIRDITDEADSLLSETMLPELKTEVKKVYEALRYSDPMDNTKLADINKQISEKYCAFVEAVKSCNLDSARLTGNNLIALIDRRNILCKRHK